MSLVLRHHVEHHLSPGTKEFLNEIVDRLTQPPVGNAILAALTKVLIKMAELDDDITDLSADVDSLIAAIPEAVSKAVSDALAAQGVSDAARIAAVEAVDQRVEAALASLRPPATPPEETPPTDTGTGDTGETPPAE